MSSQRTESLSPIHLFPWLPGGFLEETSIWWMGKFISVKMNMGLGQGLQSWLMFTEHLLWAWPCICWNVYNLINPVVWVLLPSPVYLEEIWSIERWYNFSQVTYLSSHWQAWSLKPRSFDSQAHALSWRALLPPKTNRCLLFFNALCIYFIWSSQLLSLMEPFCLHF